MSGAVAAAMHYYLKQNNSTSCAICDPVGTLSWLGVIGLVLVCAVALYFLMYFLRLKGPYKVEPI